MVQNINDQELSTLFRKHLTQAVLPVEVQVRIRHQVLGEVYATLQARCVQNAAGHMRSWHDMLPSLFHLPHIAAVGLVFVALALTAFYIYQNERPLRPAAIPEVMPTRVEHLSPSIRFLQTPTLATQVTPSVFVENGPLIPPTELTPGAATIDNSLPEISHTIAVSIPTAAAPALITPPPMQN